ncbi:amino acid adenylation domain-containing protein [Mucilaginibacter corticis]|uniref:Amino acid adenylation domain-containing protein n=1 Tax=Mucilaginibacter corticis TaxID=2597670 RepID=A0A556ML06_9SPHI|nr:Pls/PosA family non-ribosomal peptide synthetase [Mucilaginibacter corticis]TSJ40469.1 amino acid adenylation domain-containing protein [Mucilaginibacter corticis]
MNSLSIVLGADRPDLIREETLATLFSRSAAEHAGKTALVFHEQSLTYAELDRWSDVVAEYLNKKGIARGSKVGVWWQRGLELHVAILGIVKSGATYVPVDREIPAERVELILEEVGADGVFSLQKLNSPCPRLFVPPRPAPQQAVKLAKGPQPDDCAYVLYTSGSTGKPKGIPISHKQICHLVRSEQTVFNIRETDKVYQGFSVSFDMWCEETWISYFAGATIWVSDNTTSKAIDELGGVLAEQNITILHAVPSLLAVMDDSISSLRLVNAGGEACTPQVLAKWARSGIKFYNSYGPTETTVTATIASLNSGDKIVIGDPLPNYNLAVVDDNMNLLPIGEEGELVITGPGVASGYVKLPQLTQQKFVPKPKSLDVLPGKTVYRTGDAAVINPDGTVDLHGRFDDQVKLRGYRIELGEIEVRLNAITGVASAVVAIKKDGNGQDQLVGYVVMDGINEIEENLFRIELAKTLPSYMVPGTIVALDEMPRMPSGKINRKALPVPEAFATIANDPLNAIDLNAPAADRIMAVLRGIFPNKEITPQMDFFDDLGGHSLLAAGFVSQLRRDANLPGASLKDIYLNRPLSNLIEVWQGQPEVKPKHKKAYNKTPLHRYLLCWLAQTVSLLLIYGLFAFQIFIPYLGYYYVDQETNSVLYSIITSLVLFSFIPPLFTTISIGAKWLVIGKMKEGDYPLWGSYYFRWWFVKTIQRLLPAQFLNGTPLYPLYLRLLGIKIAQNAQVSDFNFGAEDLITIGDDASISSKTHLNNAFVENGLLKLRRIHLGDHAYIGSSAIISGDTRVEDWGELQDLSFLPAGKTINTAEVWQGSPAQLKETRNIADLPHPEPVSTSTRRKYKLIFIMCMMAFPFIILLPLLPTIITINRMDNNAPDYNFNYIVHVPMLALLYIALFMFETVVLTRLLQYDIKPGKYSVYSAFYVRKWFADQLMSLSLIVMHPIYATVYVTDYFRMLGAKIGKNTEISTASSVTHPLLEIGDGAFVADAVTLGEADVRAQQLILSKTIIGNNSFVGNSALIPQGYQLNSDMLIGVLSTPPDDKQQQESTARDWFGSPAIPLPRRQESTPFGDELTIHPNNYRKFARGLVEFIRIILPESAIICFSIFFIAYAHDLVVDQPLWKIILYFPFYYLFFMGVPSFLVPLVLKWVLVGKYKAQQKPMWSWAVWKSEAITSTYEALAIPFFLDYLQGTPWLPPFMRLLGVKIGKRVWMNTTDITEFDMVTICDDAALNQDCGPQTHLFEDRVMKVGAVKIGARSSVGAGTIILYDSELGDDTSIEALSLVMKGERLSPGTDWIGSPVKPL